MNYIGSVPEDLLSEKIQQAILQNNENNIDQYIDDLLSSDFNITKIWKQVISNFNAGSNEQIEAKTYYKITVLKQEIKNQGIAPINNDVLYKVCTAAEAKLEECPERQTPLVIKKGRNGLNHSLLIDFQKRTFTVCGVGPIKVQGGYAKVRSAIEVALKQEEAAQGITATYVVRKTSLPGIKITKREFDNERLFGALRTLAFYKGTNGSSKTTFTTEAYQMDIVDLIKQINDKTLPVLTFSERLQILDCIATQLECMHENHGTIHNDLKPDNVLFRRNNDRKVEAKIIDFGLSYSPLRGEESYLPYAYGTNRYASPEIVEDPQRTYSIEEKKAQDMYAFGCIAYILKNNISFPWAYDVDQALTNNDRTARAMSLQKQRDVANTIKTIQPQTVEDSYDLLTYRMLHPDPKERITVQEALRTIDMITAQ